jgi:hypothetical protein
LQREAGDGEGIWYEQGSELEEGGFGGRRRVWGWEGASGRERERQERSGFLSALYLSGSLFSLSATTTSQRLRLLADFTKAIQHTDAEEREGGRKGRRNGRGRNGQGTRERERERESRKERGREQKRRRTEKRERHGERERGSTSSPFPAAKAAATAAAAAAGGGFVSLLFIPAADAAAAFTWTVAWPGHISDPSTRQDSESCG